MNRTHITIEPRLSLSGFWRELWSYRELFFFLAWRDLLVRYKQTALGLAWSVLRPLLSVAILSLVFGRIARLPAGGVPYPVLVYAAILPWQFFSEMLTTSANSLVLNRNMITKVYFPRIIVPSTALVVGLADFLISFAVLMVLMLWYGIMPGARALLVPAFLLLAAVTSLGVGLWVSALNVKYRDFRHMVPFMVRFGLYASPVGFSSSVVPDKWRFLYSLNPMVGVIDGFRWSLLNQDVTFYIPGLLLSIALAAGLCASGIWFFNQTEQGFADII